METMKIEIVDREYYYRKTRNALAWLLWCRREKYWEWRHSSWWDFFTNRNPYGTKGCVNFPLYFFREGDLRELLIALNTKGTGVILVDADLITYIERNG